MIYEDRELSKDEMRVRCTLPDTSRMNAEGTVTVQGKHPKYGICEVTIDYDKAHSGYIAARDYGARLVRQGISDARFRTTN